ncbi:MAG: extracellular solute-binding protein [Lachnospiraceae bacterium]|nr:extracellular solute-binding protein [Lachnospiraceae bacterium]
MGKTRKKMIVLMLTLALVFTGIWACGSKEDGKAGAETSSVPAANAEGETGQEEGGIQPTKVVVWYPSSAPTNVSKDFVQRWTDAIHEVHPEIEVVMEEYAESGILEKITVAMATGATPDVFWDVQSRINPAINAGLTADLSDLAADLSPEYRGNYLKEGEVDGKTYYIPVASNNCYVVTVNMDLAREIGVADMLPEDKTHWSYDDFLEIAAICKEKGYYMTQLWAGGPTGDAAYYSLFMTAGGKIVSDDGNSIVINSPENQKAMEFIKTLVDKGYIPDGAATTTDYTEAFWAGKSLVMFADAGAGGIIGRHTMIRNGDIDSTFDMDIYMYPSPTGDTEPVSATYGTQGFCVFTNDGDANRIAAAKEVVRAFASDPYYSEQMAANVGLSPVLSSAQVNLEDEKLSVLKERADENNANYATTELGILEAWWSGWRELFYPQMQLFYTGQKSGEDVLATLETEGTELIQTTQEEAEN